MAFTKIAAAGIGSTGTVTLENLVVTGSVTGAVTGNATGLSGTPNITVGTIGATSLNASGVVTATTFSGALTGNVTGNATGLSGTPNITVGSIIASNATISGNVSVAGTLTYEDVTNVDSIGIVTARTGVRIDAGGLVVVGVTTVAAGSSAAPSISPTGDSDTGIFFPSADTIAFGEGGAEAFRITSSGNVGIGTNNPTSKLQVQNGGILVKGAATPNINFEPAGVVGNADISFDGTNFTIVSNSSSAAMLFSTNSTERLCITPTGNIGIGTNNPGAKLDVAGSAQFGSNVVDTTIIQKVFSPAHVAANRGAKIRIGLNDGGFSGVEVQNTVGSNGSHNSQNVHLINHNGGVAGDIYSLTARYDGNIGIGITNPNTKLDIVCGVGSTGIVVRPSSLSSDANGNASAVNNMIHLRMPYGADPGAVANAGAKIGIVMEGRNDEIFQTFGGGKRASIYGVSEDDGAGYSRRMGLAFYTSPFDAAEVERIRISNTGNVGIGTISPSEKTHISGTGDIKLRVGTTSSGVNANAALNLTTASEGNYTIQTGNAVSGGLRFYDTTAGAERVRVSAAGSFGIGTGNPDEILCVSKTSPDPYNTVLTHLKLINDAGNGGAGNRIQFVTGAATAWIQSFVAGANSTSGSDLVFGTPSTGTVGTERLRITSTGDLNITQTPGRYSVDVNPGSTSIANGGTVDFSIASGMLVANNHTNGNVTIYICGGGTVTAVANTGSNVGSFAYNAGINGYRWTNNYGSAAIFGFFFVRTRANA